MCVFKVQSVLIQFKTSSLSIIWWQISHFAEDEDDVLEIFSFEGDGTFLEITRPSSIGI